MALRCLIEIPVEFRLESDKVVAFVPGLDIATCGDDLAEAKRMFKEFIGAYLEELWEMGTYEKVLSESGWKNNVTSELVQSGRISVSPRHENECWRS